MKMKCVLCDSEFMAWNEREHHMVNHSQFLAGAVDGEAGTWSHPEGKTLAEVEAAAAVKP